MKKLIAWLVIAFCAGLGSFLGQDSVSYAGTPPQVLGGVKQRSGGAQERILPGPDRPLFAEEVEGKTITVNGESVTISAEEASSIEAKTVFDWRHFLSVRLIPNIVNGFIIVLFLVAILFLIIGGVTYVISSGNTEMTKKARDIIFWSIIGVVAAVMSYGIVRFIIQFDFYN